MANTFNFGNKKWATKEGSVLAYNSENNNFKPLPFDFTRASSATRVNENGLIEVVGSDEPRIDYLNNADGHLLLEPSRTNGYRNGVLDGAVVGGSLPTNWAATTPAGLTTSVVGIGTENGLSYVDVRFQGTLSATYVLSSGAITEMAASPSTAYNHSMYVSLISGSADNLVLRPVIVQRNSGGSYLSEFSDEISVTSTLNRQDITLDSSVSNTAFIQPRFYITGIVGQSVDLTIRFAGFQIEQGSYATSYIPTSGSAVTRADDTFNQDGWQSKGILDSSKGTLFLDLKDCFSKDGTEIVYQFVDSSDNPIFRLYFEQAGECSIFSIYNNINSEFTKSNFSLTSSPKIAIVYDGTTRLDIFGNGEKIVKTGSNLSSNASIDGFTDVLSVNYNKTSFKEIKLYNTALTDAELIALTS